MDVSKYLNPKVASGKVLSEKDTPNLQKSLGVKYDKVRHAQIGVDRPFGKNVENTIQFEMQYVNPNDTHCSVNDAIVGVALTGAVGNSKPLSVTRLYSILQTLENINTRTVSVMCDLSERQARKYVQACRIVLPVLEKTFDENEDNDFVVEDRTVNDLGEY